MKWEQRTLSEVLAARMAVRSKPLICRRASRTRGEEELSGESFLKRSDLDNEDKVEAVRYLERKCRISFQVAFGMDHFEWIVSDQPIVLQRDYDPLIRSYYMFGGKISIFHRHSHHEVENDESMIIEGEAGLGWVFRDEGRRRSRITLEYGTLLQIKHSDSLHLIERSCLMTIREKHHAVGKLKLFSPLDNFSKNFLPYFHPKKYTKGDVIYLIGDDATELFIIVQGVISFQSQINPNDDCKPPLPKVTPKKETMLTVTTETISKGGYFGEEEVLAQVPRRQNAKCISIDCLLLAVPQERLERMLACPEFKRSLELSAVLKQEAREHHIDAITNITHKQEESSSPSPQEAESFNQLKSAIYTTLCPAKEEPSLRSRFGRQRKRVLHNHSLSTPEVLPPRIKPSDFSMLSVNKAMYDKTLLRFRYSLKEIQREARGRQPAPPTRGRSLEQIWRTLRLQKSFNPEEARLVVEGEEGMAYYQAHQRLTKHIRNTKCMRPKTLNCNNKLKSEYIQYLHIAL